jgi:hypothetical protein
VMEFVVNNTIIILPQHTNISYFVITRPDCGVNI